MPTAPQFGRLQGWIDLLVDQLEAELRVSEGVKPGDSDGRVTMTPEEQEPRMSAPIKTTLPTKGSSQP